MNTKQTVELLDLMTNIWPHFVIKGEDMVRAWSDVLADTPAEAAMAATRQLARTTGFAPSVAEILHVVETHGWDLERCIRECRPWANYADQMQYANGSGYGVSRPGRGLPPKVARLLVQVNPAHEGWEERFRWAWKDALPR